jgi:hypothetical protein
MAGRRATGAVLAMVVATTTTATVSGAPIRAHWRPLIHVHGVVDVVGPRADGRLVASSRDGLLLLASDGSTTPFATGAGGYTAAQSGEPYVALATARRLAAPHCSFKRDDVYALAPGASPGVVRVTAAGRAARFADLPKGAFPSGIVFDTVGEFGGRLLVTATLGSKATVYALDCLGHSSVVAQDVPAVEGGIVVAPRSFGRFGGDLIAADERSGRIVAFGPRGVMRLVARPPVRAGADLGVESLGFVPTAMGAGAAYLADLGAPGSPTEGNDEVLALRGKDLSAARLRPGELVAATEGGATTVAIDCARSCASHLVAVGPGATHGEGHVSFVPAR